MAQFILNQFSFVQAALGEKQLGVNNILIWSIRRDEGGELIVEIFLGFAPQLWALTGSPQKKGQTRVLAQCCSPQSSPCPGWNGTAWIPPRTFLSHQCRRSSSMPEGLALPICLCQRKKTSPCPATPAALRTRLKPWNTPPFPLCHHTQGWGGQIPLWRAQTLIPGGKAAP